MSEPNPYRILGISENARFEEIQEAKMHLLEQYATDEKRQQAVEMAYDTILMQRLKMRQDGKIKVPERIRYPERTVFARPAQQPPARPAQQWWKQWLTNINVSDAGISALVFVAIWALYTALSVGTQGEPTYAIAIALFAVIYFLFRKIRVFWRAILYSLAALVVAVLVSESLLQYFPAAGALKGAVLFAILWISTLLVR